MKKMLREVSLMLEFGDVPCVRMGTYQRFKSMLLIVTVSFVFLWVTSLISYLFLTVLYNSTSENYERELFRKTGFAVGVMYISFIGPIMEEFGFRSGLRYSNFNFSLMVTFLLFFIARKFLIVITHNNFDLSDNLLIIGLSVIIGFFTYLFLEKNKVTSKSLSVFWIKNAKIVLYLSFMSFGLFHVFNFKLSPIILISIPLITLPQLVSGIMLSYTRLKHGIIYSIILHVVLNSIASIKFFI